MEKAILVPSSVAVNVTFPDAVTEEERSPLPVIEIEAVSAAEPWTVKYATPEENIELVNVLFVKDPPECDLNVTFADEDDNVKVSDELKFVATPPVVTVAFHNAP